MAYLSSQAPLGGAPSFYHTAHYGFVADANGKFTNFVRIPDESHTENGYWRFASSEDEHRAYACGFHTPEDVLCTVNYRGGAYEDINMQWVPGRVDTNMTSWPSGCAAQHVMAILDMRRFLGKPLSFRDQIPVYPAHPRLKDYWDARYSASMSPVQGVGPAAQPIQSARSLVPVVHQKGSLLSTPSPSPLTQNIQINRIANSGQSIAATVQSKSLTQSPHMTSETRQATLGSSIFSLASPVVSSALLPPVQPITQSLGDASCTGSDTQSSQADSNPNAAIVQGYKGSCNNKAHFLPNELHRHVPPIHDFQNPRSTCMPRDLNMHSAQSQASASVLPVQSAGAPPKSLLSLSPNLPQQHTLATRRSSPSNHCIKERSLLKNNTAPLWSVYSPYASHRGRVSPYAPIAEKGASLSGTSLQAKNRLRLQQREESTKRHEETLSPTFDDDYLDIQQLHNEAKIPDAMLANDVQLGATTALPLKLHATPLCSVSQKERPSLATNDTILTEIDPMGNTDCNQTKALLEHSPASQPPKFGVGYAKSPKRLMITQDVSCQNKKSKVNGYGHVQTKTLEQIPSAPAPADMYPELSCMDCGQLSGHKWNCHIGNLVSKQSLTTLDYRNLAESVERFDPGPWTTHQGIPPQPEPEDPLDQIRGMADVVRNVDGYKNDAELHSLPDGAMVMLWAFKTSPDMQVACF